MKSVLILAVAFCASYFAYGQLPVTDLSKLDWLEGSWKRTNSKPGQSAEEKWKKISAVEFQGTGINRKGVDTSFIEQFKVIIKDGEVYYVADVPENKEPVYFKFTKLDDNGFSCENPQHDFPTMITYQKDGDKMKATISGRGKSIDYFFERK